MATSAVRVGRGRPRRHDDEVEVRMIVDAATSVMREKGYAVATVQEILDRADVGTRAFYRHFKSKDDLLLAIFRGDAERIAQRLTRRVKEAASPRDAVEAWIDEILSLAYDERRAERMALIVSGINGRSETYDQERTDAARLIVAPLIACLRAGRRDGSFPSTEPTRDAYLVNALANEVISWRWSTRRPSRKQATEDLLRFCLPAMGWSTSD
jgi:AcrR family transcriptional regulator